MEGVQQSKPLTTDERIADLVRQVNLYKDAELAMLARARRAEDEAAQLRAENANIKFMCDLNTYVVTVFGGKRIYGRKDDVEAIQRGIDQALSRGCSHCSETIAAARKTLGNS